MSHVQAAVLCDEAASSSTPFASVERYNSIIIKLQCQLCIPLHVLDTAKSAIIKFPIYVYV